MKLSVLMPVFNEGKWINLAVEKVLSQNVPGVEQKEIILVDDGSSDGTREIIKDLASHHREVSAYFHDKNQGKGAAVCTAIENMSGDICIIQDADLEYSPKDYLLMLEPLIDGRADCVYGSRFTGSQSKRVIFFWHSIGNKFLTFLSNMFTNLNLTDMETGYKAFRCELLKSISICSKRFGIEPELTAKVAKRKARIFEVGISYNGRTYEQGKKIGWMDGFQAIYVILKYWIINDSRK